MSAGWLIRVASHLEDGGGHVARCLALARAICADAPVLFVLDPASPFEESIRGLGYAVCYEGGEPSGPYRGAIVDLYDPPVHQMLRYRKLCGWIAALDDFGRPPNGVDLVIHPGADLAGDAIGPVPALCGPSYALISPGYARSTTVETPEVVQSVFIGFGLRDTCNATVVCMQALAQLQRDGNRFRIDVAMSATASHRASVEALGRRLGARVHVGADLLPLLAKADLAVGAGGVSLYERLALGVPTISITIANNQRNTIGAFARAGATLDAGDVQRLDAYALAAIVGALMRDRRRRRELAERGRALVDGRGAQRVAGALIARAGARSAA